MKITKKGVKMVIVRFNDQKDFVEELEKEWAPCHKKFSDQAPIIRITGLLKNVSPFPIRNLYCCATVLNSRGQVIKLEAYCGDIWNGPTDEKTRSKYNELRAELVSAAERLGLEVRGGVFEGNSTIEKERR
jgi:hypothetical protein